MAAGVGYAARPLEHLLEEPRVGERHVESVHDDHVADRAGIVRRIAIDVPEERDVKSSPQKKKLAACVPRRGVACDAAVILTDHSVAKFSLHSRYVAIRRGTDLRGCAETGASMWRSRPRCIATIVSSGRNAEPLWSISVPSVHGHRVVDHERGRVGAEPDYCFCDFLGLADPADALLPNHLHEPRGIAHLLPPDMIALASRATVEGDRRGLRTIAHPSDAVSSRLRVQSPLRPQQRPVPPAGHRS